MLYFNGTKRATSLDGRALRYLTRHQKACIAANILDEPGPFLLTASQLAHMLHVAPSYSAVACKLSPETRLAIVNGTDITSFMPALRKANGGRGNGVINDLKLLDLVRAVGVTRVLDAACSVEAAE
jgi:hypothetical protein